MSNARMKKVPPRLRVPAKASVWYTASALASRIIGLLVTPIFTRALDASEYGVFPLYLGWMSVFSAVATLEIGSGAIYGGFSRFGGEEGRYLKSALVALVAVFSALTVPIFAVFLRFSRLGAGLLLVMAINVLSDAIASLYLTERRYRYAYVGVAAYNVVTALVAPAISLMLVQPLGAAARPVGLMLTSLIGVTVILFKWNLRTDRPSGEMVRYVLKSCLSFLPSFLGVAVLMNADRLIIGRILGTAAVARYSVAHSIGLALTFFTVSLLGALKPWITRKISENKISEVGDACRKIINLGASVTLLLPVFAPEVLALLAPPEYRGALGAIYPLALSVLPMLAVNICTAGSVIHEKGWLTSLFGIIAATLNVGLNLFLVSNFSFTLAGFSFLVSYLLFAALMLLTQRELARELLATLPALGASALGVVLIYFMRNLTTLRYATLALIIPLVLVTAKDVLSAVTEKE